ncbi:hypothetical protein [Enterobacter pseudoroggenkampii]|uniref:hypothetical protein n=1 Tax=Enterobacter pseudoroggenkampii TaxID=2996112 RepID=UPI0038B370A5
MSRLEHYVGRDEIILRYHSHLTKQDETLTLTGDEFMVRFLTSPSFVIWIEYRKY